MNAPKITNQGVAVFCIACAVLTIFASFWLSRADHDLKLMSLQAVLTTGGTLLGIAGTLLVGVQAFRQLTGGDLPPGTDPSKQITQSVESVTTTTVPTTAAAPPKP